MSLTINLTQLKRKKRKDGTIPIYIRITKDQKSRYKSTGISILPKYWNKNKQKVRKSHRRYKHHNRKLRKIVRKFEEKREELEQNNKLEIDTLKQVVTKGTDPLDLVTRAEKYHKSLEGTERFHEWKKFGVVLNNLKTFLRDQSINIRDVDAEFIEKFQDYLLNETNKDKEGNPKGNNPNTVRRKLTSLKGMFIRLLKAKEIKNDPFTAVDKVAEKKTSKVKLTSNQIEKIEDEELEKGSKLWHVRNYFMYSFYNAGIRFGDLCSLTWNNLVDGRLVYQMSKTGGQKSIKQLKYMTDILDFYRDPNNKSDEYIFSILDEKYDDPFELRKAIGSNNARVNLALKELAKKVGIEANLSFHISRHSFSQYALKKGMDLYSISKALGHADLKTTQQYLKSFDEEKLDTGMEQVFKQ